MEPRELSERFEPMAEQDAGAASSDENGGRTDDPTEEAQESLDDELEDDDRAGDDQQDDDVDALVDDLTEEGSAEGEATEESDTPDGTARRARMMPRVLPTIFPGPPSWPTVFGRTAPLEVELGFGRPHFLQERAAEAPDRNVVGIEWKGRWSRAVWRRQKREGQKNLVALHGNAWLLAGALFPEGSLTSIFLNFPDPWWKAKHKKRRIVSDEFAALLASRLAPGGMLLLQTDVASLLEEYLARLEAQPTLVNPNGPGRLAPRKPVGASSHREKKCRAAGVPIFRGVVRRREA